MGKRNRAVLTKRTQTTLQSVIVGLDPTIQIRSARDEDHPAEHAVWIVRSSRTMTQIEDSF